MKTRDILKHETFIYYAPKFKIISNFQKAMFLAQIVAEVGEHTLNLEERFNYSYNRFKEVFGESKAKKLERVIRNHDYKAIANGVYNGRMGNRLNSNDGWLYRGRGFIQLTGKDNYKMVANEFKKRFKYELPIVACPDMLTHIDVAIIVSLVYWYKNGLHLKRDVDEVTKVINPYTDSYAKRERLFKEILRELRG